MHLWLYGKDGYYTRFRDIGREGDFYTAVSASRFFGASIAEFIWKKMQNEEISRRCSIVEIGAHRGYLLADMIEWFYHRDPSSIENLEFAIIERQDELIEVQKRYFADRFGSDIVLKHYRLGGESPLFEDACFISNEIFDAFACDLYRDGEMAFVEDGEIVWREADPDIVGFASKHSLIRGEIATGYEEFASEIYASAKRCDFISFDYGEKYVRNDFSIRVYDNHETYPLFDEELDISTAFANSDITYDVNFAHVIESFEKAGLRLESYETQARALVRFGIVDILQEYASIADYPSYLREADKIKTLLSPTIMGDKFKMVHFCKR
jgi:SAM-dependent MidA family methyltransferase